jgi:Eco29kI restriction endonuclease
MGCGVYAIYYVGDFQDYAQIRAANIGGKWEFPIYVGKAVPKGSRVGYSIEGASEGARGLSGRLRRHAKSIEQTSNLELGHFYFRCLSIDDVWISLGEAVLIESFKPLWNTVLSGFGNNPTGGPRSTQATSRWDTLHPGRGGAGMSPGAAVQNVKDLVAEYFSTPRSEVRLEGASVEEDN